MYSINLVTILSKNYFKFSKWKSKDKKLFKHIFYHILGFLKHHKDYHVYTIVYSEIFLWF